MDLIKASVKAYEIAEKRGQYKNNGRDVIEALKHCAGEVLEANEAYNDWAFLQADETLKEHFENELADIIVCVLSICGQEGINIEKALERVFEKNERRIQKGKK